MKIIRAQKNDAKHLTELTLRSKNYWNYGEQQIEEWKEELTISEDYIEENEIFQLINYEDQKVKREQNRNGRNDIRKAFLLNVKVTGFH